MRGRSRYALSVLLAAFVLLTGTIVIAGGQESGEISSVLGPQLLLVSPQPGQVQALGDLPLTLHADIAVTGTTRYISSAPANAYRSIQSLGVPATVLDRSTRGKVYYFLDAQAEDAWKLADRWGRVVYSDDLHILLGMPAARERAFLDAAAKTSTHIQLLTSQPVYLGERSRPGTIRVTAAANPIVVPLLPLVTSDRLSVIIADLSGERAVNIGGNNVSILTRYTFSAQIANAAAYVRQSFARLGLSPQDAPWTYGRYSGVNIIADIVGSSHPERIWLLGGHFDDTSQTPYTRAPGADDNASGIASMLVIADILRRYRFQDTIRFVAFSGEEQGMWGSKSYAARLNASGAQIMGYLDLDMIGWDGNNDRRVEVHSGTRASSIELANAFIGANTRYGTGLTIELKQSTASRFSDHSSFWDAGYAAFLAIEDFYSDGRSADRNPRYHNTGDLLSNLRLDYVVRYTQAALATIAELAGINDAPTPTPTTASPTSTATGTPSTSAPTSPTPTSTATATPLPPTATPTATPGTMACRDVLANGDMELATGWTFGRTSRSAGYTNSLAFSSSRSLRSGVEPWTSDRRSHSSAYQSVTIPRSVTSAILTAQLRRGTTDWAGDYQEILLLNTNYRLLRTLWRGLVSSGDWQPLRFDVTGLAGQTVVIYFNAYNDGDGRRTWMYVDDVHLMVCTP